jgi:CheY-like chemotaxis protein
MSETPRVLVVDDNALNLELTSVLLTRDGMAVAIAQDAHAALAQVDSFRPHLVLMDIQLPDIDGLELTRRLRAEPSRSALVIVAFTAYAMKGDRAKMLAGGCDGYLSKPVDVAHFAAQVREFLQARRAATH